MEFENALKVWEDAQDHYIAAREDYRKAYAQAYLASDAKTGDQKKYAADLATSELRRTRDELETEAAAAWQHMLHLRGPAEAAAMPGRHFEAA